MRPRHPVPAAALPGPSRLPAHARTDISRLPAVHNACDSGGERDLTADVRRTPVLRGGTDSAAVAGRAVARGAGAGRMP
ncbi:hypothetical protein [Streptomyces achromogenes]|uniref:hypothetical protein n=1 Tax=Streptomyces achromogenes TaxID=67255 RepID=UPI0036BDE8DD